MSRRRVVRLAMIAPLLAATTWPVGPADAAVLTNAAVAALSPTAQAARLQPLRRLAGDLDQLGRARYRAQYAGVSLSAGDDTVDLYVTSASAGRRLIGAARARDAHAEWRDVRLRAARFSAARLDAAARALTRTPVANRVESISLPAAGTGLDVAIEGSQPAAALTGSSTIDGVPVAVHREAPTHQKSWAAAKWHDSTPFIGGDYLTRDGHDRCTAGLPAVARGTGKPVMITAAHCFAIGTRVYTGAGTPGDFGNGLVGNYVGTAAANNREWDAVELTGANDNGDESDRYGWKPLTSVAYSYDGDYVCQNGAASFFLGHPTPCGIKVTDDDLYFKIGGYWARGVEGVDVHGWGSHNGDSGGTVFAVEPNGARQARGIVSSGGADGTVDQQRVDWTEAVDIFRAFDLKLNPQT